MESHLYSEMAQIEKNHWWFNARRKIIMSLIRRYAPNQGTLLDVGMGTGLNAKLFAEEGFDVEGLENAPEAIEIAQKLIPNIQVITTSFPSEQVPVGKYRVITMLDVLEHIPDDTNALAGVTRALAPGGIVLITVPAFPFLWTRHDELAHHVRRYRKQELVRKLSAAELTPVFVSYYNFFLFPPIAFVRLIQKIFNIRKEASDFNATPGFLNVPLAFIFSLEQFLLARTALPFGVSLVCIARKSS